MNVKEIKLNLPRLEKNRVVFSWSGDTLFKVNEYWVEYPDLNRISCSESKLTEALFPLCLAFSSIPEAKIILPTQINERVLINWRRTIQLVSMRCFKNKTLASIQNGKSVSDYEVVKQGIAAVSFGGGVKSLLSLGRLMEHGARPILASFGGPAWSGSDPEKNPDKLIQEERLSKDFGLPLLRVRTNFREVVDESWSAFLTKGTSMLNSVLRMPFYISLLLPVAEQLNISRFSAGLQKLSYPKDAFCFTPEVTSQLNEVAYGFFFEAELQELYKEEICRELYQQFPHLASYQYSCWHNQNERWCYNCELCLEYYLILKSNGVDASVVGLNDGKVEVNLQRLIKAVSQDPDSRKGEIWERIYHSPKLISDVRMREILKEIKHKSSNYHRIERVYAAAPSWLRKFYRNQKDFLKKLSFARGLSCQPVK